MIIKPELPKMEGVRIPVQAGDDLSFADIKDLAKEKALGISPDVMLLSWYDGKAGKGHPDHECGAGDKPAWIVFAEARGGNIIIDVNDGAYIFIYLGLA